MIFTVLCVNKTQASKTKTTKQKQSCPQARVSPTVALQTHAHFRKIMGTQLVAQSGHATRWIYTQQPRKIQCPAPKEETYTPTHTHMGGWGGRNKHTSWSCQWWWCKLHAHLANSSLLPLKQYSNWEWQKPCHSLRGKKACRRETRLLKPLVGKLPSVQANTPQTESQSLKDMLSQTS